MKAYYHTLVFAAFRHSSTVPVFTLAPSIERFRNGLKTFVS